MLKYMEYNVNPKHKKVGDCSTRAIVSCLGIDYDYALDLQFEVVKKTYEGFTDRKVLEKVLEKFGYVKMKQPRKYDNTKYMVREMDQILTAEQLEDGVVVNVANHYVAIKGNAYIDIWNSGYKSVGNFYAKVR